MPALAVSPRNPPEDAAAFLGHLDCAPRGFGAPSALAFARQLRQCAEERAGEGPLVLLILGEPLSGKSTFLSNLLTWLLTSSAENEPLQVKLIRWGDAMRAERQLGLLPPDRVPGDLSDAEFAGLSAFVGEQVLAARAAVRGPGLVIAEAPGCTAVMNGDRVEGLDRGFSTCRALVKDEGAYYVALAAEPRLRLMFLQSRETAPGDATNARSATPLAANRINEQVTRLMAQLQGEGRLAVPDVAPGALGAAFDRDPAQREQVLFEWFLPHLVAREIGAPSDRALIARNVLVPAAMQAVAQADTPFVDQFDYMRERYNL